jgi:exonuclease VII small subunit
MKQVIKAKIANINSAVAVQRAELESITQDLEERLNELEDSDCPAGEELESAIAVLEEAASSLDECEALLDGFLEQS